MIDTSVTKVSMEAATEGEMGQRYLAAGTKLGMRLWHEAEPTDGMGATTRPSAT